MTTYRMEVIPEPKKGTGSTLAMEGPLRNVKDPHVLIRGDGENDYHCGACNALLGASLLRGQIIGFILKCGGCHSFNVLRGS